MFPFVNHLIVGAIQHELCDLYNGSQFSLLQGLRKQYSSIEKAVS